MCELVLLVVPVLQRDEDAQVVRSRYDAHTCAGKLCAQLIVSFCGNAFLRTVDVEGGDGRVVGGLFGKIRDRDSLAIAGYAVGAAGRSRVWCLHDGVCVFDFPVTLQRSAFCGNALGV